MVMNWDDGGTNRGFNESRVSANQAPMREGDYSPDGNWIVFEGYPDGVNHDIYIMTAGGTSLLQLTTSESFDFDPAWSPSVIQP
jgi:Tol biopolymer transport system component